MNKIYHLSTCSTNKRILRELDAEQHFVLQDIKTEPITPAQLDEMKSLCGSYEALFSRRSRQYTAMGLKDKVLTEADYRKLILQDYTFLKRPVILLDGKIYIGNDATTVAAVKAKLLKN